VRNFLTSTALAVLMSWTASAETLEEQRNALLDELKSVHKISPEAETKIRKILSGSSVLGQGNPAVTKHPMTRQQCEDRLKEKKVTHGNAEWEKICGAKFMAPLYDPAKEKPQDAKSCIDQFEFPNIPCSYPVVWVKASEAQEICSAIGKRMCDAHEWEGGCQGELKPADYDFAGIKGMQTNAAINKMRREHNQKNAGSKRWAFGPTYLKGTCGANSTKDNGCNGGDWKRCGSNTYPTGAFSECVSPLGVYDQHGNAAEHMNLPLDESQMTSKGSATLGHTEMKGSWFIFDKYHAHEDWCRWRAPYWHGTTVMHEDSHHNYHLGFRCCNSR
jgi:formylglycine-generating enzyme required for sulfatase activity